MLSLPLAAVVVAVVFALFFLISSSQKLKLPKGTKQLPGPKGYPFAGNLPDIPPKHSWLKFKQWADLYGPIFKISIAGAPQVIVSTEKIANELMRERGTIYSSRVQSPMSAELLSDNLRPLFLPYGEVWRNGRKLMHHLTMDRVAKTYQALQEEESIRLLRELLRDPPKYEQWLERYAAGLMMRLAFGQTIYTGKEVTLRRIYKVVHHVERIGSPGAYLVDTFPSLMLLPSALAPFKREGARLHAEELDLFRSLQRDVALRMQAEEVEAKSTFTAKWLDQKVEYDLSDDEAAYVVGTLFEAGASTTAAAMMSFILSMIQHPDCYSKLKDEVDRATADRLPTFDDVPNLPYMRACVKETLRWRPVTAGGAPHLLTKDDVYQGYFLPAGTNVHANQWAIHREPALYPDPETFRPERWLDPRYPTYREPLTTYPNLQNFSAFGFGRRICPGQNIAERSLNIIAARIAWTCDLQAVQGHQYGEYDFTSGFNVQPKWFPFELAARGHRGETVDKAWNDVWAERVNRQGGVTRTVGLHC